MPDNSGKTIGAILKEARLVKNITLEDASKHTHIHVNILCSMESDDFGSLGKVYAKSFLKLYAEYLNLDKENLVRSLEGLPPKEPVVPVKAARIQPVITKPFVPVVTAQKRKDVRPVIAVVLAFFIVMGFIKFIKHRRALPRIPAKAVEVKKTPVKKKTKTTPAQSVSVPPQVVRAASRDLPVRQPMETLALPKTTPMVQGREKIVLVLRAKEKTWLQVKVDGKIMLQGLLARGAAESWQAQDKIELWLGNAGAVQLELNGRLLEKIGRPGQTLRHVVVTREGLSVQK